MSEIEMTAAICIAEKDTQLDRYLAELLRTGRTYTPVNGTRTMLTSVYEETADNGPTLRIYTTVAIPITPDPVRRYKLIASCKGETDDAVLDMLIAHGCWGREDVLAMLRDGERTDVGGLVIERVAGGWHLLRELTEEI